MIIYSRSGPKVGEIWAEKVSKTAQQLADLYILALHMIFICFGK